MATDEIWKPIPGYEGYYDVSNKGRVRSLVRKSKYGVLSERKTPRINSMSNRRGYYMTWLYKEGEGKHWLVHRLVALAFIPNPNNLPFVNHKDENPSNNFVYVKPSGTIDERKSNLEWCTTEYNNNYGTVKERMRKALLNRPDLSMPIIRIDKEGRKTEYPSMQEASRVNGTHQSNIWKCCNGERITCKGYRWQYK